MKLRKRILALILAMTMMCSMLPAAAAAEVFEQIQGWNDSLFTDVDQNDWFYDNVKSAYELGLMKGDGNGQFLPGGNITLAETVTVAARIHAIAVNGEENFVQGAPWYKVYVDYALAEGILDGELDDYGRNATRLEYAHILSRALPKKELKAINDVKYGDIPDVEDDEAVYLLYRAGVLMGSDDEGTFYPYSNIQRSEVAAIITRMALPEMRYQEEDDSDFDNSGNIIFWPDFDWDDDDTEEEETPVRPEPGPGDEEEPPVQPEPGPGDEEEPPVQPEPGPGDEEEPPVQPEPPHEPEEGVSVTVPVENEDGAVKDEINMESDDIKVTVPAGVALTDGAQELTLTVDAMDNTGSDVTLGENEDMVSYDVHIEGVAADNTVVITVAMGAILPKGMNWGNVALYHVEDGDTNAMTQVTSLAELDEHNEFYYDPATGEVTLAMSSFSEVAVIADIENKWNGDVDISWYTETIEADADATDFTIANADQLAGFGQIVGGMAEGIEQNSFSGKTVKLIADINLGDDEDNNVEDKIFYPIGYYNSAGSYEKVSGSSVTSSVSSFEGTFDGNGHTIANFYQNTWEMFGDYNSGYSGTPNHYKDAMGLFGYVVNGTIKNLTVDNFSSDGEFTPTGVIAAYAVNSTFENIAITNCNPRVYNTGNGGIVGIGGNSDDTSDKKLTFTNITIDNTNKITALWGSWDVACGGLVGMFRGAGHVYMTNCHVAAQVDVYNDVCGNYQYYWYRYAGMMVGTNYNMTEKDGYTVPETEKFHAEGCTVHFGEWNDYYYCELVDNSLASYTHDHQFSRLEQVDSVDVANMTVTVGDKTTAIPTSGRYNYVVVNGEPSTENATCYHFVDGAVWNHKDAGFEDFDLDGNGELDDYKEDRQHYYLPFNQLFTGYGWGVKHIPVYNGEDYAFEGITILDRDVADSVEKFESKFTGDFLYRVGNGNAVSVGSLFEAVEGASINVSSVYVTIDKVDENTNVSGIFTPNTSNWEQGTIQFSGTGLVKITIQDYQYCEPTELYLEVVDAKNATSATSATANNVVLLNDVNGGFTVSNGYAVFGNGFKVTCSGNGAYGSKALSYGFITVEKSGILDNVQVICDIFPASYLYTIEMSEDTDGRYPYAYSAVAVTGNSTISNCYIYGARNNIFVGSGNVTIENTVTECGSLSNIQIKSTDAYTVTLDDVTTIQYQTTSSYDESKKVLGFGIVVGDNESTTNPTIKLTGDLKQYNWVTSTDTSVSNTYAKTAITEALKVTDYQHTINDTTTTVNMGIAYLNAKTATVSDERSNAETIPYKRNNITMSGQTGQVYSIAGSDITADNRYDAKKDEVIPYKPEENRCLAPTISFESSNDALTFASGYDSTAERWQSRLTVDLDNMDGGSYDFKFSALAVQKHGSDLEFTVKDSGGNAVDKDTAITLNQLFTGEYTLEITDNLVYDANGKKAGETVTHSCPFIINVTKTSIEPPKFTNAGTATAIRLVTSSGGDWRPAYTVLTGVSVTYWSSSESKVKTVDLSTLYNSGTISSNVWTYTCDDYTLTITGGAVHSDGSVITPVVANNTLYFASTNKAFGTGTTSRSIVLTYVFTDKNASTTWNRTETVTYSELSEYDYNSFKNNGTLTEPSSSSGCVTPDTLITLADGTQVPVTSLTGYEQLLVWNMETGTLDSAPVLFVDSEEEAEYEVVYLHFSDETVVKVIYEHGFWDYDLNRYVYLDENAAEYIGHTFAKQNGGTLKKVQLVDVVIETELTTAWSPVTMDHLCYFVNGMLSMPGGVGGLFNIFDVDPETMTYDKEAMARDIETYGLFTYEELNEIVPLSEDMFNAAGGAYLKVSIGKGNMTMDELVTMINRYSVYFTHYMMLMNLSY